MSAVVIDPSYLEALKDFIGPLGPTEPAAEPVRPGARAYRSAPRAGRSFSTAFFADKIKTLTCSTSC